MIAFLSFLGLAAGLTRLTRLPFVWSPLATATALITVLTLAAALGWVKEAITILHGVGVITLAGLPVLYGWRRGWSFLPGIGPVPPATVLFVIFGCGAWLITGDARFTLADEFSHWGTAVKQLLLTDSLPHADSPLLLRAYPPGATVFDAFFLIGTRFRESDILFAQSILFLSCASAMLAPLTWRRPLVLVSVLALIYALIATFSPQGAGLMTAYVDHIIGALAGAAIILHFSLRPRWRFGWVTVLCVFTLPLIKDAGLFLALMVAAACGVAGALDLLKAGGLWKPGLAKRLLLIGLLFGTPLTASQGWNLWLGQHDLVRTVDLKGSVAETIGGLIDASQATPQQKLVAGNLGPALLGTLPGHDLPLPVLVCALWGLAALIVAAITGLRRSRRDAVVLTVVLGSAFAVFVIGLLRLYSFTLSFEEARMMTSFERYMGIVLLPLSMIAVAFLTQPVGGGRWRTVVRTSLLAISGALWLLSLPASTAVFTQNIPAQVRAERDRLTTRAAFLVERAGHPGRVTAIWYGRRSGVAYYAPFMDLLPLHVDLCASSATPQPGWIPCRLSRQEWIDRLNATDWLLILRDNAAFRAELGPLFPPGALEAGLFAYRVVKTGETVRLEPVDPAAQRPLLAVDEDVYADTLPVLPLETLETDSEDRPSYRQENLFDGQPDDPVGRSWSSLPTAMPHFVRLGLKQPTALRRILVLNPKEGRLRALDVITGLNGQETLVARLTGLGDQDVLDIPLTGAAIDSLRLVVRKSIFKGMDTSEARIGEIILPGYRIGLPDWPALPVLPLESLETDSEDLPSYRKDFLFDGNAEDPIGRVWSSLPTAMPHFVFLKLHHPTALRRMVIINRNETRLSALDVVTGLNGQEKVVAKLTELRDTKAIEVPLNGEPIDSLRIVVRGNSISGTNRMTADIAEIEFPGYRVSLPEPH